MPKKVAAKKTAEKKSHDAMTVAELKAELKAKGLATDGRKADLIERLKSGGEKEVEKDGASESKKRPLDDEEPEKEVSKKAKTEVKGKGKGKGKAKAKEEEDESESEEEAPPAETEGTRKSSRMKEKEEASKAKEEAVGKWEHLDESLYILNSSGIKHGKVIAGFDMDDTLIETKSGKTFAISRKDWQWLYPEIPAKLKELHANGTKIVIFTNQAGINGKNGWDGSKFNSITGKIEDIIAELGFPVQAFVATTDDIYRKPATAMWDAMVKYHNAGIQPDLDNCIYVGDAAGRPASGKKKKDFSCSDRKFAFNVGIKFATPEEFFRNEPSAVFDWDAFDLTALPPKGTEITDGGIKTLTTTSQEIVLFVGFPASGKSTLAKTYMIPAGYTHVNRDTLKTSDKCVKVAREAVASGKSVVIDNTNPDPKSRADYIQIAKDAGIPIRCFRFELDVQLAHHLNYFRERITNGESKHVPSIGYNMYKKNFQEPTLKEGFAEIKKIRFVPNFQNPDHEKQFKQLH